MWRKETLMVHPAFKSCLAHEHRRLTQLRHTQMTAQACCAMAYITASCVSDATVLHVGHSGPYTVSGGGQVFCLSACLHMRGPGTCECPPPLCGWNYNTVCMSGGHRCQKTSEFLELELQRLVSHYVDAGDEAQLL